MGKRVPAAISAGAIAVMSFVGASAASAGTGPYHKPAICIVLPLCQSMAPPAAPAPKPHHHIVKKMHK
jgi:hypothetical protein